MQVRKKVWFLPYQPSDERLAELQCEMCDRIFHENTGLLLHSCLVAKKDKKSI